MEHVSCSCAWRDVHFHVWFDQCQYLKSCPILTFPGSWASYILITYYIYILYTYGFIWKIMIVNDGHIHMHEASSRKSWGPYTRTAIGRTWLQIPVNDVLVMDILQSQHSLPGNLQSLPISTQVTPLRFQLLNNHWRFPKMGVPQKQDGKNSCKIHL